LGDGSVFEAKTKLEETLVEAGIYSRWLSSVNGRFKEGRKYETWGGVGINEQFVLASR
jgi:hypothetical protein